MKQKLTLQYRNQSFNTKIKTASDSNLEDLHKWLKGHCCYKKSFSNFKEEFLKTESLTFELPSQKEFDMAILSFKRNFVG